MSVPATAGARARTGPKRTCRRLVPQLAHDKCNNRVTSDLAQAATSGARPRTWP